MPISLTMNFNSLKDLQAWLADGNVGKLPATIAAPADEVVADTLTGTTGEDPNAPTKDDVDGDGMPYDDAVHSDPPAFTANGLWRAKRGKAKEAETARAEFKAKGGDVAAPEVADEMPLPTMTEMPAMPGMPADAPEPVNLDTVLEKIKGMLARGSLTGERTTELYQKVCGSTNGGEVYKMLQTNETMRAALYTELCQIEPELS